MDALDIFLGFAQAFLVGWVHEMVGCVLLNVVDCAAQQRRRMHVCFGCFHSFLEVMRVGEIRLQRGAGAEQYGLHCCPCLLSVGAIYIRALHGGLLDTAGTKISVLLRLYSSAGPRLLMIQILRYVALVCAVGKGRVILGSCWPCRIRSLVLDLL